MRWSCCKVAVSEVVIPEAYPRRAKQLVGEERGRPSYDSCTASGNSTDSELANSANDTALQWIQKTASFHHNNEGDRYWVIGVIQCDPDFNIVSCDSRLLWTLEYQSEDDLIGRPITTLMSPLGMRLHQQIFRRLRNATQEQRRVYAERVKRGMSNNREFVVFTSSNMPVVCGISVVMLDDNSATVELHHVQSKLLHSVPRGFEQYINTAPGLHVKDYSNVICLMMDLAGSTAHANTVLPQDMAALMHVVYMTVNDIVLREVFPFAYIHEICGDSIMLIVNAGFMVRWSQAASVIAMHAASAMQIGLDAVLAKHSNDMFARVGLAVGDVSAGVMDGRSFRVFGSTVHLSQRLESVCPRGKIACDSEVYGSLMKQMNCGSMDAVRKRQYLKGYGETEYLVIDALSASHEIRTQFFGTAI